MMNEMSCWDWDWTAIGAVATALTGLIALWVWMHARLLIKKNNKKRIMVIKQLMLEELIRITANAVGAKLAFQKDYVDLTNQNVVAILLSDLQTPISGQIIDLVDEISLNLGVEAAKFISIVSVLKKSIQAAVNNVMEAKRQYPDLPAYPPEKIYRDAALIYSEKTIKQAIDLAEILDEEAIQGDYSLKENILKIATRAEVADENAGE